MRPAGQAVHPLTDIGATMPKEYRIVGKWGMWGDILCSIEDAEKDLQYCIEKYQGQDQFHIEERDVSKWRGYGGEENASAEESKG